MRGKPSANTYKRILQQDHPRGCGENSATAFLAVLNTGSPPRMRGKHIIYEINTSLTGITPADAGKTLP